MCSRAGDVAEKRLSYSPVNPFDSFHTWRESTDPTFSNSLAYFTLSC
jgi:hypothetical protein